MTDQYEQAVSKLSADEYWQRAVESGWLDNMPAEAHAELEKRVREAFVSDPLIAWSAFYAAVFDSEMFEDAAYTVRIEELAKNSYGGFQPENIQEEYLDGPTRISFELKGKTYEYTTQDFGDYFDEEVINVINQALREVGEKRQFHSLPVTDQVYYLVFVTPETYENAERLRLIPPYMYFEYKERSLKKVEKYLRKYYKKLGG